MRVGQNYYAEVIDAINNTQAREQTALTQLSTGKRVNMPSDNPTASALLIGNHVQQADVDRYEQNINSLQSMMQSADSALSSVVTSLNQAITYGTQGANGTLSAAQVTTLATSVSAIRDQIVSLANTSVQGVYLFGGSVTGTAPFTLDTTTHTVTYQGNNDTNSVPIGDGDQIQSNVPGNQIFTGTNGNVMQSLTDLANALQAHSSTDINSAVNELQAAVSNISNQRASYGNAMNRLTAQTTSLQSTTVELKSQETSLVGVDMATAATNLSQAQTALQATLEAAAKTMPMSLLNYLPTT
jgi:flagellar hook-associated protein 3 FlgL